MLYDLEDRQVIARTEVRKSLETTRFICDPELEEHHSTIITQQLVRDIARCQTMLRLADNDFSTIATDIDDLVEDHVMLPPNFYKIYMDRLDSLAREDEGKFMWLFSYLIANLPYLADGLNISDHILRGETPLTYREVLDYIRARDLFLRMIDYCADMEDTDEVRYSSAHEYALCCHEECSIMLRIGSGKEVSTDAICLHLDWSDNVSPVEFERICVPELDTVENMAWEAFCNRDMKRIGVMYGRCFANGVTADIIEPE